MTLASKDEATYARSNLPRCVLTAAGVQVQTTIPGGQCWEGEEGERQAKARPNKNEIESLDRNKAFDQCLADTCPRNKGQEDSVVMPPRLMSPVIVLESDPVPSNVPTPFGTHTRTPPYRHSTSPTTFRQNSISFHTRDCCRKYFR